MLYAILSPINKSYHHFLPGFYSELSLITLTFFYHNAICVGNGALFDVVNKLDKQIITAAAEFCSEGGRREKCYQRCGKDEEAVGRDRLYFFIFF